MATDMTVANEIARQLGRGTLGMIGAKNLAGDANSLQFSIMRNDSGINKIVIRLDPTDTYTVEFWKIGRAPAFKCEKLHSFSDIYADGLHDLIQRTTGLAVRVPRVKGINC